MFAMHLRTKKRLEFWQVDKNSEQPIWAEKAFVTGGFRWSGERLAVQNVGGLLKMTVPLGDVMVFNGKYLKAVPKAKFMREYRVD
ncbi:hypothetical protein [Lactococcus kimchii]|uniref:hypothetical protein n=1 Tax=Lactococcus sp. S-13 TaxID=2507158 RepID=UPI001022E042|nr:hypothetical protein [Lactococcus sp. S-13]RZI49589.1 hypothetical protein EQJ87_09220 [Lactococcus sp. S-13]